MPVNIFESVQKRHEWRCKTELRSRLAILDFRHRRRETILADTRRGIASEQQKVKLKEKHEPKTRTKEKLVMPYQNISAQLAAADIQAIKDAVAAIRATLPFLVSLTTDERKKIFKTGPDSVSFVQNSLQAATAVWVRSKVAGRNTALRGGYGGRRAGDQQTPRRVAFLPHPGLLPATSDRTRRFTAH